MCDVFAVNKPQAALRFSLWVSKYRWQSQNSKSNTVVAGLHNSLICDLPSSGKRRRGDLDSSPALAVFWLIWTAGQMFPWAFTTFSLLLSLFCCSCCSLCCLIYFHLAFSSPVPGFSLFFFSVISCENRKAPSDKQLWSAHPTHSLSPSPLF